MVKVRLDGVSGLRWLPYARWWWEQNRGPVPKGRRVCHLDGDLLNDDPANFAVLTPGEVFSLYHKLDPAMSRANRVACGRSATARNLERSRAFRATRWVKDDWYAVDFPARVIHNAPRRQQWMVYHDHGLAELIGRRFAAEVEAAKAGDVDAAAFVLRQMPTWRAWWRWVRPASLGWPGVSVTTACMLSYLADVGTAVTMHDMAGGVARLRQAFGWRPFTVGRSCLYASAVAAGEWIGTRPRGRRGAVWWITGSGLAARVAGSRIVPVRGAHLTHPRFNGFERREPSKPAVGPEGTPSCQR